MSNLARNLTNNDDYIRLDKLTCKVRVYCKPTNLPGKFCCSVKIALIRYDESSKKIVPADSAREATETSQQIEVEHFRPVLSLQSP